MQTLVLLQQGEERRVEGDPKQIVAFHTFSYHTLYAFLDL